MLNKIEDLNEQVTKYQTVSPVIIISLDGRPEKWPHCICEWFTPEECFDLINELKKVPKKVLIVTRTRLY